ESACTLALALVLSGGLIFWTLLTNAYLGRMMRIQEDRGHQVVTGGPYRSVRHPMYVGIILFFSCMTLFLGSWWALVPAGLIAELMVVRIARRSHVVGRVTRLRRVRPADALSAADWCVAIDHTEVLKWSTC
ncbi:MAG: hypothetical protein EHM35_13730, partial [Planctomycetaceae bacterium]